MNAIKALKSAMFYISGLYSMKIMNRPGAVIEKLNDNTRCALQDLKSDDIGPNVRLDNYELYSVGSNEYYQKQEEIKDRLEFDKKLKK